MQYYDIKALFDAAIEVGHKFTEDSDFLDIRDTWIRILTNDHEFLEDIWLDALCELPALERKMLFNEIDDYRMCSGMLEYAKKGGDDTMAAVTTSFRASRIGIVIGNQINKWIADLVDTYGDEWYADCYGYKCDMEEGMREDYEYERAKDRMLDDREG